MYFEIHSVVFIVINNRAFNQSRVSRLFIICLCFLIRINNLCADIKFAQVSRCNSNFFDLTVTFTVNNDVDKFNIHNGKHPPRLHQLSS